MALVTLRIIEDKGPPAEIQVDETRARKRAAEIAQGGFFGILVSGQEVYIPWQSVRRIEIDRTQIV